MFIYCTTWKHPCLTTSPQPGDVRQQLRLSIILRALCHGKGLTCASRKQFWYIATKDACEQIIRVNAASLSETSMMICSVGLFNEAHSLYFFKESIVVCHFNMLEASICGGEQYFHFANWLHAAFCWRFLEVVSWWCVIVIKRNRKTLF